MNIKYLLQKSFAKFATANLIKLKKQKKKKDSDTKRKDPGNEAVSEKVSAIVGLPGEVKVKKKKNRRKPNSKVKSVDIIIDSENEDSAEEEPANAEDVIVKIEPEEIESADDNYTYVRGRGKGKYICQTCGIRCLNPSRFTIHLRTHTNERPYTCEHCKLSYKTKNSLNEHNKSKNHRKKCMELGAPVPTSADDQQRPWTLYEDKLIVQAVIFNEISQR